MPGTLYKGMALLRSLADGGKNVFTVEQARRAADDVGIGTSYLIHLLGRLAREGWIERIKKGTYVITAGLAPEVHGFAIGMALVDPCAVSGWAALNHHGLTDQVPRLVTLSTPKRAVTPAMRGVARTAPSVWEVGERRFEIECIVEAHFFGHEEIWLGESRVRIFDRERALLDCFALPRRFGGISVGLSIVERHRDVLDVGRLVSHARRYAKASVAKRVGYALEMARVGGDVVEPLLEVPIRGYRPLDPTGPRRGVPIRRWHVRDNLRDS
jgi:predicted transcriptional regulator of viral defense system